MKGPFEQRIVVCMRQCVEKKVNNRLTRADLSERDFKALHHAPVSGSQHVPVMQKKIQECPEIRAFFRQTFRQNTRIGCRITTMRVLLVENYTSSPNSRLCDGRWLIACAEDSDEAMSLLRHNTYDLILLNMSTNPDDGFTLIGRLRAGRNETPLLALTASGIGDRVKALELGADEAMAGPVDPTELRACMASITGGGRGSCHSELDLGDLSLNLVTQEVRFRNVPVPLTDKEFALLELMVLRRGTVLTKTSLLNHLYSEMDEPEIKIIDVFICKLRKKLERAGAVDPISTIWGQGYMLRELAMHRHHVIGNDIRFDRSMIA
jgi:two-component system cell cycle response regulator CtrA